MPRPSQGSGPLPVTGANNPTAGDFPPHPTSTPPTHQQAPGPTSPPWASQEPAAWRGPESGTGERPPWAGGGVDPAAPYDTGAYAHPNHGTPTPSPYDTGAHTRSEPPNAYPGPPAGPVAASYPGSGAQRPTHGSEPGTQHPSWEQQGWNRPAVERWAGGGVDSAAPYDTGAYARPNHGTGPYTRADPPTEYTAPPPAPSSYAPHADVLGNPGPVPPPDPQEGYGHGYEYPNSGWAPYGSYGDNGPTRFEPGGYRYGDQRFG
ncbi:hypothetical protein EFW17_09860 [Halostreptopolyspora alba]|uniref:Uncharacterized protein n=1 Tax=Halostreptopolyspora alba TaxID=2487137 RepID=A0A3N0EB06_9ACTN|nr:hypothetical protein EFW17_09860 [Nocardiopsaceae bacterium YIM 96095]